MFGTEPPKPKFLFETRDVPEQALRTYARLWQFETWLRRMVYIELRALSGDNWAQSIPPNSGPLNADKRLTHMPTREFNSLSYSQLSQLLGVIETHWNCFGAYFPPQDLWKAKVAEISQIRHRVAHFRSGHSDDYPRVLQFLRDVDHGFWTFCTSYNDLYPVLPQSADPVNANFLAFDALPWVEIEPKRWARVGAVDRSLLLDVTINLSRRPWAPWSDSADGKPGYFYDVVLTAQDRIFDYGKLLERTERLHQHVVHIGLDALERSVRLILPAVLGAAKIIEIVEQFQDAATNAIGRTRSPIAQSPDVLVTEWPEYVLGPEDPLSFLEPEMKCSFFDV